MSLAPQRRVQPIFAQSGLSRTDLSKPEWGRQQVLGERLSVSADMRGNRRDKTSKPRRPEPGLTLLFLEQLLSGNRLVGDIGQFEQEIDDFVFE
jgi:hypothetical protein